MKKIFENIKKNTSQYIMSISDIELDNSNFMNEVESQFKVKSIQLIGEKEVLKIKEIPFLEYHQETGQGGSYTPGQMIQKIQMTWEVDANRDIFDYLIRNGQLPSTVYFSAVIHNNKRIMLFQAFDNKIIGNEKAIARIYEESFKQFDNIKAKFNIINEEIESFNVNDLKPFILERIEEEKRKRNEYTSTISALR